MLWRRRRWARILTILEHLPRTSAYAQAMATDPELAKQVLGLPDGARSAQWRRSHRDYTAEVEMLSAVFDRLGELIRTVAASRGARSRQPTAAPRPIAAIERIRRQSAEEKHRRLTARVLPNR